MTEKIEVLSSTSEALTFMVAIEAAEKAPVEFMLSWTHNFPHPSLTPQVVTNRSVAQLTRGALASLRGEGLIHYREGRGSIAFLSLSEKGRHASGERQVDRRSTPDASKHKGALKPVAFLSHATKDGVLAKSIAEGLVRDGIDTFYAEWSIADGDSLVQRIETGIRDCTHFLVLLTPNSVGSRWVRTEIDAGLISSIEGRSTFISLVHRVSNKELSPFLQSLKYRPFDDPAEAIPALVRSIRGESDKPALGTPTIAPPPRHPRLSPAAMRIAEFIVNEAAVGTSFEYWETSELVERLALSKEEFELGFAQLQRASLIKVRTAIGVGPLGVHIETTRRTFVELDQYFKPWVPKTDAVAVARLVANAEQMGANEACETLGWEPRRLNPALAHLLNVDAIIGSRSVQPHYETEWFHKNANTLLFLHDAGALV